MIHLLDAYIATDEKWSKAMLLLLLSLLFPLIQLSNISFGSSKHIRYLYRTP